MKSCISAVTAALLALTPTASFAQEAPSDESGPSVSEALAPSGGSRGRYQLGTSLEVEWVDTRLQPPGQRRIFTYILDTHNGELYLCQASIEGVIPDPCGRVGYLP